MGTALVFPASTSLVSQRTDRHEVGLSWARSKRSWIMSIVGPIAGPPCSPMDTASRSSTAAAVVGVARVLANPRATPHPGGGHRLTAAFL